MKVTFFLLFFFLAFKVSFGFAETLSDTVWFTKDHKAKVKLTIQPDKTLSGHIIWLKKEAEQNIILLDKKNHDKKMRSRPLLGSAVLWDLKRSKKNPEIWSKGRIYAADKGKTYQGRLERIDMDTLKVQGCISLICKSQIWKRVK